MTFTNTRLRASEELKAEFARRLLKRLAEVQMTQSDLARRIGVSKDAISTYARRRSLPAPPTLRRISTALGCKPEDLLPKRFDHAPEVPMETPLALEFIQGGKAILKVNLEVPSEVAIKMIAELKKFAPSDSK